MAYYTLNIIQLPTSAQQKFNNVEHKKEKPPKQKQQTNLGCIWWYVLCNRQTRNNTVSLGRHKIWENYKERDDYHKAQKSGYFHRDKTQEHHTGNFKGAGDVVV